MSGPFVDVGLLSFFESLNRKHPCGIPLNPGPICLCMCVWEGVFLAYLELLMEKKFKCFSFPVGVIAAVVLVLICLLVVMLRYMYRHKGTYHTNEAKGTEFAESADAALKNDPTLQDAMDENRKEYFI